MVNYSCHQATSADSLPPFLIPDGIGVGNMSLLALTRYSGKST